MLRFGLFAFDSETGDIWKDGRPTRLPEQARVVLLALVERQGQVVTREELRSLLWGDGTFVDVDTGLNAIVTRIRHALADSASSPRFIETLPRRGYRFIAPVAAAEAVPPAPRTEVARTSQSLRGLVIALAILLAAGGGAALMTRDHTPAVRAIRAVVQGPAVGSLKRFQLALSPRSDQLVIGTNEGMAGRFWWMSLGSGKISPIPASATATYPAFSADGQHVAFCDADGRLQTVSTGSFQASTLLDDGTCGGELQPAGIAWNDAGEILFGHEGTIRKVAAAGGAPVDLLTASDGLTFSRPEWLPDDRHFLVQGISTDPRRSGIYLVDATAPRPRLLCEASPYGARFVEPGLIVYVVRQQLVARRFDRRALALTSEPLVLDSNVSTFAVNEGTIVYYEARQPTSLGWWSRDGRQIGPATEPHFYNNPRLSPDDSRVVYSLPSNGDSRGIWIHDFVTNRDTRVTGSPDADPVWSPDGTRVLFDRGDSLLIREVHAIADETQLLRTPQVFPSDWSRDGGYVALVSGARPAASIRRVDDPGQIVVPTIDGAETYNARFSPDGRLLAYTSDDVDGPNVYVVSFPDFRSRWKVSAHGGTQNVWRRDGAELYYVSPESQLMAVRVHGHSGSTTFDMPAPLFSAPFASLLWPSYDVASDGQRFLINSAAPALPTLHLISNWRALIAF